MAREHYSVKLKREIQKLNRQLFVLVNDLDSVEASTIRFNQRFLKSQSDILMYSTPYFEVLKSQGILDQVEKPYHHYEAPKEK